MVGFHLRTGYGLDVHVSAVEEHEIGWFDGDLPVAYQSNT